MAKKKQIKKNSKQLIFSDRCTIYEVAKLHGQIKKVLGKNPQLSIDLSSVQHADAAFLQLLLAVKTQADNMTTKLEFHHPSAAMTTLAEELFFDDLFDKSAKTKKSNGH